MEVNSHFHKEMLLLSEKKKQSLEIYHRKLVKTKHSATSLLFN